MIRVHTFFLTVLMIVGVLAQSPVVVLNQEEEFEIKGPEKAIHRIKIRYLINNVDGQKYSYFILNENKFKKIKKLQGHIRDLSGKKIKKLKKDDVVITNIYDYSILDPENKLRVAHLVHSRYPYIAEYESEQEYKSLFYWPDFIPINYNFPTKRYVYKLIVPVGFDFQYKLLGETSEPVKARDGDKEIYQWEIKDVPRAKDLWGAPGEYANSRGVLFKPTEFTFGEYSGNNTSWESFGSFYRSLAAGRYTLPRNIVDEIKQAIGNPADKLETIQKIYEFVQKKTRYQAVYLDVGGVQPHSATSVYQNCYGDCKDLATLLIAILRVYNIEAWPALIHTRERSYQFFEDFPSSQFNHAICAAFVDGDTLWLDGTLEYLMAGKIHPGIEGQPALLIKDSSAEIVRLPRSKASENVFKTVMKGQFYNHGMIAYDVTISLTGNEAIKKRERLNTFDDKDQKQWWLNLLSGEVSNLSVKAFSFTNLAENRDKPLKGQAMGVFKGISRELGSRLFVNPNIFSGIKGGAVPPSGERKWDYVMSLPYTFVDSVQIQIKGGYKVEALPEKSDIVTPFAEYHTEYAWDGELLSYVRVLKYTRERIPASQYEELRSFRKKVVKLDKQKVVLIK